MKRTIYLILLITFALTADIKYLTLPEVLEIAKDSYNFRKLQTDSLNYVITKDNRFYYYFPSIKASTTLPDVMQVEQNDSTTTDTDYRYSLTAEQKLPFNSNLSATYSLSKNDDISEVDKSLNLSLNTDFYYGMSLFSDYDTFKRSEELAKLSYNQAYIDYQYELISKFYSLFRQQEDFEIEKKNFELGLENFEEGERKYKVGLIPEVEYLELELFLERKKLSLENSKNSLKREREDFFNFIGIEDSIDSIKVEFSNIIKDNFKVDYEKDLNRLLQTNYNLKNAKFNIDDKEDAYSDVYKNYFINSTLSLYHNVSSNSDKLSIDLNEPTKTTGATLKFAIPIFDKMNFINKKDKASVELKLAEDNLKNVRENTENNFKEKIRRYNQSLKSYEIAKKSQKLSEKIYNISKRRFEFGLITSKDLISYQISYIQARQDLINSEINYILSVLDYKRFIGEKIY